jgi:hypothetical protein
MSILRGFISLGGTGCDSSKRRAHKLEVNHGKSRPNGSDCSANDRQSTPDLEVHLPASREKSKQAATAHHHVPGKINHL